MSRRRKSSDTTPFDTLRLEGSLFVPELLERAASGEAALQKEADYAIPKGLKLHDEYGRAFRIATASWQAFAPQMLRADVDAATVTRAFVIDLLRQCLGYTDLTPLDSPIQLGDRGFPVTAQASGGRLPIIIAPHHLGVDDPDPRFAIHGSGLRKKSAQQLAQEFLNASPNCLWAIVTNGKILRLLRDADTLTRPNFLEFDLETILRDDQHRYADFSALWRILHASRSGGFQSSSSSSPTDCIWEQWKSEGHAQGLRRRSGLRDGVKEALLILGTGFLTHRDNEPLRQRLHDGTLTTDAYFQQLLRLIYRCLFLFCAEERNLIHPPLPKDENEAAPLRAARLAYATGYALRRLRRRCLRHAAHDPYGDLWLSSRIVFLSLIDGEPRLALPALGGLFAKNQCPDLDSASLTNRDMLTAMRELRWFVDPDTRKRSVVDYKNMGTEELGSIYESLLELVPQLDLPSRHFKFVGFEDEASTAGNARKTTGSHYTPDQLVVELVHSALDPVIAAKLAGNPENPIEALLSITLCDPACGSGHFLLAGARRIAEKLAELRFPDGYGDEVFRHALREVISHCVYGVDRNPMAIELARTALWLEGFEPGKPLSFLDHRLVCGDALLGIDRFAQMENGIPDSAFKPLSGDDKETCKVLTAINRAGKKDLERHRKGEAAPFTPNTKEVDVFSELASLEALSEDTPLEVEAKRQAYGVFLEHARNSRLARAADCFLAAFIAPKHGLDSSIQVSCISPTTRTLLGEIASAVPTEERDEHEKTVALARDLCRKSFVLHWPLAFPLVFAAGGFDCILGNPPWERIKLQEEEFFANRAPAIIAAKNKAERSKRIQWLSEGSLGYHLYQMAIPHGGDPKEIEHYRDFIIARRLAEATSLYAHLKPEEGTRFPLTGVGDVNTYALFSEAITRIVSPAGRAGFIVPTGIATDDSTKAFFGYIATSEQLASLFDFENSAPIFSGVHRSFKFCLLTLGRTNEATFAFYLTDTKQLSDERRSFTLAANDFALLNPNTRTCPVFRSRADAELARQIYQRLPVLIEEGNKRGNPWDIRFSTMFHMSNDSYLFQDEACADCLPLYEAKMIHQYDHRWATYRRGTGGNPETSDLTLAEKSDPTTTANPRYWVPEDAVFARIARVPGSLIKAWQAGDHDLMLLCLAHWVIVSVDEKFGDEEWEDSLFAQNPNMTLDQAQIPHFEDLPETWLDRSLIAEARTYLPLDEFHYNFLRRELPLERQIKTLIREFSPDWLLGFRDICRATDERTVISSIIPRAGVGNNFPIMLMDDKISAVDASLLAANLSALPLDFVARHKVGGTHLNFFIAKQLPIIPPDRYTDSDKEFIIPRVLELTFTSNDLESWAELIEERAPLAVREAIKSRRKELGLPDQETPFAWDANRRAVIRAELDARYASLYGLTRNDLRYILDPSDTHGDDYPSETFRVLKSNEMKNYGEYRTQRLVLEAWDRIQQTT
jgi:hypothetical protein